MQIAFFENKNIIPCFTAENVKYIPKCSINFISHSGIIFYLRPDLQMYQSRTL